MSSVSVGNRGDCVSKSKEGAGGGLADSRGLEFKPQHEKGGSGSHDTSGDHQEDDGWSRGGPQPKPFAAMGQTGEAEEWRCG